MYEMIGRACNIYTVLSFTANSISIGVQKCFSIEPIQINISSKNGYFLSRFVPTFAKRCIFISCVVWVQFTTFSQYQAANDREI